MFGGSGDIVGADGPCYRERLDENEGCIVDRDKVKAVNGMGRRGMYRAVLHLTHACFHHLHLEHQPFPFQEIKKE